MKVLVAKNEGQTGEALRSTLEQWGYDPVLMGNGEQTLEHLTNHEAPGLVLLDRNIEDVDSLEIVKKVRQEPSPYPPYVILFDHQSLTENIVEALEAGGDDYITELSRENELKARVHVGERMVRLYRKLDEARQKMAKAAMHDSLTGILNRKGILDRLHQELARAERNRTCVGVGMGDIDHFKRVNDTYGHQVGDQILEGIVHRMQNNLREYDCVGRYGGEEFLIVTPDVNEHTVGNVFARLRRNIANAPFPTDSDEVSVTASFGVIYSGDIQDTQTLIAEADQALYRAKENGRNQVCQARQKQTWS